LPAPAPAPPSPNPTQISRRQQTQNSIERETLCIYSPSVSLSRFPSILYNKNQFSDLGNRKKIMGKKKKTGFLPEHTANVTEDARARISQLLEKFKASNDTGAVSFQCKNHIISASFISLVANY